MNTVIRRMMASLVALAAVAAATSTASAQVRPQMRINVEPPQFPQGVGGLVLANRLTFPLATPLQQRALLVGQLGAATNPLNPLAVNYNPVLGALNTAATINTLGAYGGIGGYGGYGLGAGYFPPAGLASTPYGAGAADSTLGTSPAYGNPYYPSYYGETGGALMGLADITTANANGVQTLQRARVTMQQANQAAIDTRRKLFDELRYERMNTPGAEDIRIKDMEVALRRARHDPPQTEIVSGRSLNDLINHLSSMQAKGLRGPDIRLNEDLLSHINLTNGANGNVGLLRNGGKLNWPLPLQSKEYADLTREVNTPLEKAARAAVDLKPVDPGTLKDLKAALDKLNEALDNSNSRLTPNEYIESKRYLNMLGETYRALQDPDVGNYFKSGKWTAQGNTVAEFVDRLTRSQGLRVAPASPGDEQYYRALQAALVNYDAGITALTSTSNK
jgi:hypothetical protein